MNQVIAGTHGFSTDPWNSLLTLLNNQSTADKLSSKIDNIWILDLGCSHHMNGKREFLTNLKPTSPYTFRLQNGTNAIAQEQGSACLGPNFTIHYVLF